MSFKGTPMQHNTIKFITITFAGLLTLNATAMQRSNANKKNLFFVCAETPAWNPSNIVTDPIAREHRIILSLLRKYPEQLKIYKAEFYKKIIIPFTSLDEAMRLEKDPYARENKMRAAEIMISTTASYRKLKNEIDCNHPELSIYKYFEESNQASKAAIESHTGFSLFDLTQMNNYPNFIPRAPTKSNKKIFSLMEQDKSAYLSDRYER